MKLSEDGGHKGHNDIGKIQKKSKDEKFYQAILCSHRLCVGVGGETDALGLQSVPDKSPQLGWWKEVVGRLRPAQSAAAPLGGALDRLLLLGVGVGLTKPVCKTVLSSRGGGRHRG